MVVEEAVTIALRRHTLLPLDDCRYALQLRIPTPTRAFQNRCLQQHGISRLPEIEGETTVKTTFKSYPIRRVPGLSKTRSYSIDGMSMGLLSGFSR